MSIGYKPKGSSGELYHPDRDYAYLTPTLMAAAIERMASSNLPDEVKRWKEDNDITEDEIGAAAEALARAQRDFVNAADPVVDLDQALRRRDFYAIRYPVRLLLTACIGEVFCAAWFTAVREVSKVGEHSPAEAGMADFAATVRAFVLSNNGQPLDGPTARAAQRTIATLQFNTDVLLARNKALYGQIQQLTYELAQQKMRQEVAETAPSNKSWFHRLFAWM
jgi:hypothetical protein